MEKVEKGFVLALQSAERVERDSVWPNPRVGASVLDSTGKFWSAAHQAYGGPHAEANLIEEARRSNADLRGGEWFITLEPCAHHGKTPPCASAILELSPKSVNYLVADPNPRAEGGASLIAQAEVCVEQESRFPELIQRAEKLNREWLFAHRNRRPFVTLKAATSLDGSWKDANNQSQWITSERARDDAAYQRRIGDWLLTSRATVERDNPKMTARSSKQALEKQPHIGVLYRLGQRNFQVEGSSLATHSGGVTSVPLPENGIRSFLEDLYRKGVLQVWVEGGPQFSALFFREKCVEEVFLYFGARFLGGKGALPDFGTHLPGVEGAIQSIEPLGKHDFRVHWVRKELA